MPAGASTVVARSRERVSFAFDHVTPGHGRQPGHRDPLVVHDWDSVIAQPETAMVGLAAALWPREGGSDPSASVAQTADFITSYQRFADREWEASEVRDVWAASLWLGLFFAKQEAAEGGSQQLDRLADEIDERLHRAALK